MIDAHVHIFPSISGYNGNGFIESLDGGRIRLGTGQVVQALPPEFIQTSCDAETLLRNMDAQHVEKAVLMQGNYYGTANRYLYEAYKKWPDRLTFSCLIDPYANTAREQMQYVTEQLGCRTIKLECSACYGLSGFHPYLNYEDEYFAGIFDTANRLGMTVVIDTGTLGTRGYQPETLGSAVKKYTDTKFVVAHLGFPPKEDEQERNKMLWDRMIALGQHDNVWFDLSSLAGTQSGEYPYPLSRKHIESVYRRLGSEKLIFGTDFPGILNCCTYGQAISFVRDHCTFFSKSDLKNVMEKNAEYVYWLKK